MHQRHFGYHHFAPSNIPPEFPKRDHFLVLHDIFHSRYGSWQRFVSLAGIRYVLVLHYNSSSKDCLENNFLEKIYSCFDDHSLRGLKDDIDSALSGPMTPFLTYLRDDFTHRNACGTLMRPVGPLDFDRDDCHSLQLKTVASNLVCISGNATDPSVFRPIDNKFPRFRTFPLHAVHVIHTITMNVFKVVIDGNEYCLKAGRPDIGNSIRKFSTTSPFANIPEVIGLVVNSSKKVVGYLTSFIHGKTLDQVVQASSYQKEKWKGQLGSVLQRLHKSNIVWGDAKPDNIILSTQDDDIFLIDFDGGCTDGWVDPQYRDSKEGDLQALKRINDFIDSL